MSLFNKVIGAGLSEAVEATGNAIDNIVTSDEERGQLKNELTRIITEHSQNITNASKEVILAEANGNWLQRSWRPILMLLFGFILIYEYFIANIFGLPKSGISDKFWDVMEIGIGGFIFTRSAEKITNSITTNFDKLPGKRK